MGFDIILHAGTLVGLLFIYWRTWIRLIKSFVTPDHQNRAFMMALIIATIPAVIAGLLLQDYIVAVFRTTQSVGLSLIVTALVLILAERFPQERKGVDLPRSGALWIGCAQAFALIPGLSRAGLTIGAGRMIGLSRKEAIDFSFLMATPVIAGALILTLTDFISGEVIFPQVSMLIIGFIASMIVSIVAIVFLRRWVVRHSLGWFGIYLIPVGVLLLLS